MKGKPLAVVVTLLMALVLGPETAYSVGQGPSNLGFSVSVTKRTFVLNEPVYLTCKLENPITWDIAAEIRSLALEDKYLRLSVQDNEGKIVRYYSGPVVDTIGGELKTFGPGDTMVETIRVFFNDVSRGVAFPRLGRYTIRAKVYLGNHPTPIFKESSSIEIEVIAPLPADQQIIESLGSEERLVNLLRNGTRNHCKESSYEECFEGLRALVAELPGSNYSPSIAFMLATSLGWDGAGVTADYDLEAEILQEFLRRWPAHPLAPVATRIVASALQKAGKREAAMEWVRRFEMMYPDRESPRHRIEHLERRQ